jgi:hypothetical protein
LANSDIYGANFGTSTPWSKIIRGGCVHLFVCLPASLAVREVSGEKTGGGGAETVVPDSAALGSMGTLVDTHD